MHIEELQRRAAEFKPRLEAIKRDAPEIQWFHGDILSNIVALAGLLKQHPAIFGQFEGGRIADVGAADGDLAFFLEAQGYGCDIIDYPDYNYNRLRAARHLHMALASRVGIYEIDLDGRFELPGNYDAVLLFGVLYHLRNPYYALENLAHHARFCFLSSRIARWVKSGSWPWQNRPRSATFQSPICWIRTSATRTPPTTGSSRRLGSSASSGVPAGRSAIS